MNMEKAIRNLEVRGFQVSRFSSKEEAADYLDANIKETSVGIGGSVTVKELGIADRLKETNKVFWHWEDPSVRNEASACRVYLTSANAVSEEGEIINIDGSGNRVAATLNDKDAVYIIVGKNKFEENYDKALWRARNIASPKNAQRLKMDTPCAKDGDKCYDCKSPQRVCRGLVVLWGSMVGVKKTEVIIIDEDLGL